MSEATKSSVTASQDREAVVVARGLTKVFKDFWGRAKARAVDNVDFEIRRGEVFGLLGPNGSGKSTTIKMLLGLLYPTKGHIEVFGHSPRHVQTKSRIGYLPEESYLYRFLDSGETVDFFGKLFELSDADRKRRTEQLLEMVGLSQVRRRVVGEFSKGMQRRVGLAQALINDPDLVILDEPTAGLDPIGCREIKDLILALAARGKTVILSSHLLSDVEDVCDRVVIYFGGKIQAMGSMGELLAEPDSVQFRTPALDRASTERILGMMRQEIQSGDIDVSVPNQSLERYFLNIVETARNASKDTSGATSGNRVAEYLRGDAEGVDPTAKALDRLTAREPEPAPVEEPDIDTSAEREERAHEKLAGLSSGASSEPIPEPEEKESEAERIQKANEKLSSLLGSSGSKEDSADDHKST